MPPVVLLIADILTAAPSLIGKVRDLILGNPGATPADLLAKLEAVKVEQKAAEDEWLADMPAAESKPEGAE